MSKFNNPQFSRFNQGNNSRGSGSLNPGYVSGIGNRPNSLQNGYPASESYSNRPNSQQISRDSQPNKFLRDSRGAKSPSNSRPIIQNSYSGDGLDMFMQDPDDFGETYNNYIGLEGGNRQVFDSMPQQSYQTEYNSRGLDRSSASIKSKVSEFKQYRDNSVRDRSLSGFENRNTSRRDPFSQSFQNLPNNSSYNSVRGLSSINPLLDADFDNFDSVPRSLGKKKARSEFGDSDYQNDVFEIGGQSNYYGQNSSNKRLQGFRDSLPNNNRRLNSNYDEINAPKTNGSRNTGVKMNPSRSFGFEDPVPSRPVQNRNNNSTNLNSQRIPNRRSSISDRSELPDFFKGRTQMYNNQSYPEFDKPRPALPKNNSNLQFNQQRFSNNSNYSPPPRDTSNPQKSMLKRNFSQNDLRSLSGRYNSNSGAIPKPNQDLSFMLPEDFQESNSWRFINAIKKLWLNSKISESTRKELIGIFQLPDFYVNPNLKFAIAHGVRSIFKAIVINSSSLELIRQYIKEETGDDLIRPRLEFFSKIEPISFPNIDVYRSISDKIKTFNLKKEEERQSTSKLRLINTNWKKLQILHSKKAYNFISISYLSTNKNYLISEIGWVVYNASNNRYLGRHFVVSNDSQPIQNETTNRGFMFGPSTISDINTIMSNLHEDIVKSFPVIIAGFGLEDIYRTLKSLGINLKTDYNGASLSMVDTLLMYKSYKKSLDAVADLETILDLFNIQYSQTKNSGNDSAFNMMLLIKLLSVRVPDPVDRVVASELELDSSKADVISITSEYIGLDESSFLHYLTDDFDYSRNPFNSSSYRALKKDVQKNATDRNNLPVTGNGRKNYSAQAFKPSPASKNGFPKKSVTGRNDSSASNFNQDPLSFFQQNGSFSRANNHTNQPRNFRPSFSNLPPNNTQNRGFGM
ncbi:hypothetical protein AYI68_g4687 [Smittium mucronatum]|uniref:Gfd2/YDR514C-like C-terminal domain-containing protein n=1 Tax=Smittium mucronatum TaxID=133383 RepID=A0A1R0GWD8_9FUNG|nr:hypothetical protein AYI68_g4687 [Smittium mucronatum]